MKKLVSTFIVALMVLFTACNSAEVKEGQKAGKAYIEAFNAANGDFAALNAAYVVAATSFSQVGAASDQANLDWQNGFIDACSNDMNVLGTYYAFYATVAEMQGQDFSNAIESMTTNLKDKGAEFKAAYDQAKAMIANAQNAPAEATTSEATATEEEVTEESEEESEE